MALRIKRGTNAERLAYTPELGELIYVTDYSSANVASVYVGDGSTAGGNAVQGTGGGSGGLADIVNDTTPQLGGNLDLNSYDITGTGDINITGGINATLSLDVNLNGSFGGNVSATTMTANTFTGNVDGDIEGSVYGDDSTIIVDGQNNRVVAPTWYGTTHAMVNTTNNTMKAGNVAFGSVELKDTTSDRTSLTMIDDTYPDIALTRTDAGDISPVDPVSAYGTIRFKRDDQNGLKTGVYMQGGSAGFAIYNLADGSTFDNNRRLSFTMDGNLGIGKIGATKKLDVNGSGIFSGSLTAASMQGTFVADDSTILVDGVAGKVNIAPNNIEELANVVTTTPQAGQVLKYNGSEWVNGSDNAGSGGAGGGGSIGVGADDSSVRLIEAGESFLIKGGANVTTTSDAEGNITIVSATELSGDTTPQLGGNLDTNTKNIAFGNATTPGTDNTLILGTGNDMQLYHDGVNSYIKDAGDGGIRIVTNLFEVRNAANNEVQIDATEDGATRLYYNGSSKMQTTTNGVTVTGTMSGIFDGDLTGSVFADDSTLVIDGTNGTIQWARLAGTPTTLAGYGITDAATSAQGALAASAVQPATLGNFTFTSSVLDSSDSSGITVTPAVTMSSDLNVENNLNVTNVITANRFTSTSTDDPEIKANANLKVTAGNAVVITSSPVRFCSFTTTARDALASANGDMVYNSTTNKFQGYANGAWVDLH
jgi:hypothetical protein